MELLPANPHPCSNTYQKDYPRCAKACLDNEMEGLDKSSRVVTGECSSSIKAQMVSNNNPVHSTNKPFVNRLKEMAANSSENHVPISTNSSLHDISATNKKSWSSQSATVKSGDDFPASGNRLCGEKPSEINSLRNSSSCLSNTRHHWGKKMPPIFQSFKLEKIGHWKYSFLMLLLVIGSSAVFTQDPSDDMPHTAVADWASTMSTHLAALVGGVTKFDAIKRGFEEKGAKVKKIDGVALVKEMSEDIKNMMAYKLQAVKRIMNVAEESFKDFAAKSDEALDIYKNYTNAKKMIGYEIDGGVKEGGRGINLTRSRHFDEMEINTTMSSIHVPTNVYDESTSVLRGIKWSEKLDRTFISNYDVDPTLHWQYFGSAHGFLRQYPAAAWTMNEKEPDLYDARLRSWYIQAANSPKDVVILLDVSGSMTGLRQEISKHVVLNILDTLNENDFVNIFTFSETTQELVPCFNDTLVQANLENIGEFKMALNHMETEKISNFSQALTKAFLLLSKFNSKVKDDGHGSQCNQAIMLVTDGSPYEHQDIFKLYNWPQRQVRMFTYLVGREETDLAKLKWMACANKGYFVHVSTLAEVREKVLKYIHVVARPHVLYRDKHHHIWTGVYADVADSKQTEWLWELRERKRQLRRSLNYKDLITITSQLKAKGNVSRNGRVYDRSVTEDPNKVELMLKYGDFGMTQYDILKREAEEDRLSGDRKYNQGKRSGYRLMTSVAVPVFDLNETSNITYKVLERESIWVTRTEEVKSADLLGVAGTDVPIDEIQKLIPPYKLGVNGYSFIVNENGNVLFHPDLRPTHEEPSAEVFRRSRDKREWFQDILKPNYNSVDLNELELPADASEENDEPRFNHSSLMDLRQHMIDQKIAYFAIKVKLHMDGMKRVVVRKQEYHAAPIEGTPFSLGIVLPGVTPRANEVFGEIELSRLSVGENVTAFFQNGSWSVHPNWVYCEYKYEQPLDAPYMDSPEALFLHFLDKAQKPGWRWSSNRTNQPTDSSSKTSHQPRGEEDRKKSYFCDKELIQALLFDAQVTDVYNKGPNNSIDHNNNEYFQTSGIGTAFVATRSGLTRWKDTSDKPPQKPGEPHFMETNKKAIDEIWYKRAVDYYEKDPSAYVFSVPFDAGTRDPKDVLLTISRAVVIRKHDFVTAPAAVVGATMTLDSFTNYFKKETQKCSGNGCINEKRCSSPDLDCYLLDDSGFIVASENVKDAGRFFGEIEGTIMNSLVMSDVYSKVKMYDYQAVCLDGMKEESAASIFFTPIQVLKWTVHWMSANFVWLMLQTQLYQMWDANAAWAYTHHPDINAEAQYQDYDVDDQIPPPPMPSEETYYEEDGREEDNSVIIRSIRLRRNVGGSANVIEPEGINEYDTTADEYDITADYESIITNIEDESLQYNISEIDTVDEDYAEDIEESDVSSGDYEDENEVSDKFDESFDDPEEFPQLRLAFINKTRPRPCDKETTLYNLNVKKLSASSGGKDGLMKGKLSNCHTNGCGRPFSVQKVTSTNLVLVVVNNICPCDRQSIDLEPKEVLYNETDHCYNLLTHNYRKRPEVCVSYHPNESDIDMCKGCSISSPILLLALSLFLQIVLNGRQ